MARDLCRVKSLPEPMTPYCQLVSQQQTSVKFQSKYNDYQKCMWLCCLQNGDHFVIASMGLSLQWRHNERDQIPSRTIVYSNVYSGADQRKHQSSASLAFVRGIHWWPVNSPHKWSVMRKMFPFDDVIILFFSYRSPETPDHVALHPGPPLLLWTVWGSRLQPH